MSDNSAGLALLPLANVPPESGHVTALHADGIFVVAGTSEGHLLLFTAPDDLTLAGAPVASVALLAPKEKRAVRAVKQLVVLASVRVVVVLCNGLATVHALDTLAQLCVLNNAETKAEALCCNCDERLPRVVLLVAAQSSLLFYRLANPVVLYRELPVRTPPSTMTWQGDALSLAHATGVTVIDANVGHTLFEQGFAQESRLCAAYENQRWVPLKGWGQTLLPGDMCGQWCDAAFRRSSRSTPSRCSPAARAGRASGPRPRRRARPGGLALRARLQFLQWRQENLRSCVVAADGSRLPPTPVPPTTTSRRRGAARCCRRRRRRRRRPAAAAAARRRAATPRRAAPARRRGRSGSTVDGAQPSVLALAPGRW